MLSDVGGGGGGGGSECSGRPISIFFIKEIMPNAEKASLLR